MFVPKHQRDAIKVRNFCGLMLRGFIGITNRELAPICGMTFSCLLNAVRPRDKADILIFLWSLDHKMNWVLCPPWIPSYILFYFSSRQQPQNESAIIPAVDAQQFATSHVPMLMTDFSYYILSLLCSEPYTAAK